VPVAVDDDVHRFLVAHPQIEVTVDFRRTAADPGRRRKRCRSRSTRSRASCLVDGIDELEYLRRHETAIAVWEARHG